jgi:hypothetical protein
MYCYTLLAYGALCHVMFARGPAFERDYFHEAFSFEYTPDSPGVPRVIFLRRVIFLTSSTVT